MAKEMASALTGPTCGQCSTANLHTATAFGGSRSNRIATLSNLKGIQLNMGRQMGYLLNVKVVSSIRAVKVNLLPPSFNV